MAHLEMKVEVDELIAAIKELTVAIQGRVDKTAVEAELADISNHIDAKETQLPQKEETPVTIDQVKTVLAAKSVSGKNPEVKTLIAKYGAPKLTEIDPAKFSDLLQEAEAL